MKKKGFTLIELLAVIVILAIIAVITVPRIADMISSSRQGGAADSFYGTLKAAELGYTKALQSNTNLKGSTCNIADSKITCTNGVKMSVSGKTPESGTIALSTNGVSAVDLTLNGYKCTGTLSTEKPCTKNNGPYKTDTLKTNIITNGDGLYAEENEAGRLVYRGSNPNNYVKFNNEMWRIVSIEADGTLKIIKDESIGNRTFDPKNSDTSGPRFNSNNTYCEDTDGIYKGCNAWNAVNGTYVNGSHSGTVTKDAEINTYLNTTYYNALSTEAKNQMEDYKFKTGNLLRRKNINTTLGLEKKTLWEGKVGLLNLSDWLLATTNNECNPLINAWYNSDLGIGHDNYKCSFNNYLFKTTSVWWLLNPVYDLTAYVYAISVNGYIDTYHSYYSLGVRPVAYLKNTVSLTGTGTGLDPYLITQS